jgi:hypothetical protein
VVEPAIFPRSVWKRQLKRDWRAAEDRWRDAAHRSDQKAVDEAYKAAHALTMELHRHPWMQEHGNGHELRIALREAARQQPADG